MSGLSNEILDGDRYPADWDGMVTHNGEDIALFAKISRLPDTDIDLILDMKWSGIVSTDTREWIEHQTDACVGSALLSQTWFNL